METLINASIYTAFAFLGLAIVYEFVRAIEGTCQFARTLRTRPTLSTIPAPSPQLTSTSEPVIELAPKIESESEPEVTEPIEPIVAIATDFSRAAEPTLDPIVAITPELSPGTPEIEPKPEIVKPVDPIKPIASELSPGAEESTLEPEAPNTTESIQTSKPDFSTMTLRQLRDYCKIHKVKGYSKCKTKAALANFLTTLH